MFMSPFDPGRLRDASGYSDPLEPALLASDSSPRSGSVKGIDLRTLPSGTALMVDTHNSRYRIIKLDEAGSNALIQGGPYFGEETKVRIEGSALTGSLLKTGWIGLGLLMEVSAGNERIVTSRVRAIRVEPNPVLTHSDLVDSAA
jgi:hypothetical protein